MLRNTEFIESQDITAESRHYVPEEQNKAICLNEHPHQRPTHQYHDDPTKKC
jgi:hypothetical protein